LKFTIVNPEQIQINNVHNNKHNYTEFEIT